MGNHPQHKELMDPGTTKIPGNLNSKFAPENSNGWSRWTWRSIWKATILLEIHPFLTEPWWWEEVYLDVSENRGTPKSSILIGFSIINHPFWGPTPIFGNTIFRGKLAVSFKEWLFSALLIFNRRCWHPRHRLWSLAVPSMLLGGTNLIARLGHHWKFQETNPFRDGEFRLGIVFLRLLKWCPKNPKTSQSKIRCFCWRID